MYSKKHKTNEKNRSEKAPYIIDVRSLSPKGWHSFRLMVVTSGKPGSLTTAESGDTELDVGWMSADFELSEDSLPLFEVSEISEPEAK